MNKTYFNYIKSVVLILLSSFIQAYSIQSFILPSKFLTGGFTGVAILINTIFNKIGINVSISFLLVLLNFPVAFLCYKKISKKFVFLSLLQICATSYFLTIVHFKYIFSNIFLNITIGGVVYGFQLLLALLIGGSTGGTDFIALYISNIINKSIWMYVYAFNIIVILIFGYIQGWDSAGYSILFQFITTKLVDTFYRRYHRITVNIITKKSEEIILEYVENFNHGITKINGEGGYSKQPIDICYTVVSVYELSDVIDLILRIDKDAIINTYKTESFYGNFYIPPM